MVLDYKNYINTHTFRNNHIYTLEVKGKFIAEKRKGSCLKAENIAWIVAMLYITAHLGTMLVFYHHFDCVLGTQLVWKRAHHVKTFLLKSGY